MKVFSQMSRRVSLSLSQFKPWFIRAFNALHRHTHTHKHMVSHTQTYTHLPLVAGFSESVLFVCFQLLAL